MLVQFAWAATRTKGTYLRAKYDSLVVRRGKKRALIAVGHKILIATYFILKDKVEYKELGYEYLQNLKKDKKIKIKSLSSVKIIPDMGVIDLKWASLDLDGDSCVEFSFGEELQSWLVVSSDGLKDS